MLDAARGFIKDGNKNRLREQDIHRIVDTFTRQTDTPRYARMVPFDEIADPKNDFNLNLPRYIDSAEPEDLHDIDAHLRGGIPERDLDAFSAYWQVLPGVRATLFESAGRPGYARLKLALAEVKPAILGHAEFTAFNHAATQRFADWRAAALPALTGFGVGSHPKALIETLAEDLLAAFRAVPLLDAYDVYQHLMDYWAETMQDDVYLIAADGWLEAARPRGIIQDKNKKIKETPDLVIKRKKYKMDLAPPALIVARFFAKEQAAIEALEAAQETAARELEEFVEEHATAGEGEEGLLAEATNDKGKVTKGGVKDRLKAIKDEPESDEECDALKRCLELIEAESAAGKAVKDAQAALDAKVLARYAKLTEAEIKTLVIQATWFTSIRTAIEGEVERLTQQLGDRVKELEERYARPLPELEKDVEAFGAKVEGHLMKMGLA
jgi:type I restriction enzyme M protein